MTRHPQLNALDLGEPKGKKRWRKPYFSVEEPTAPTTQMAFAQKGNPPIPISQRLRSIFLSVEVAFFIKIL